MPNTSVWFFEAGKPSVVVRQYTCATGDERAERDALMGTEESDYCSWSQTPVDGIYYVVYQTCETDEPEPSNKAAKAVLGKINEEWDKMRGNFVVEAYDHATDERVDMPDIKLISEWIKKVNAAIA